MNSNTADQTATGWALLTISEGEVVASIEYGDDEGTARTDYDEAIADEDGHGYRLTCNGYTYAQHLEPVAVFRDDVITVTLSPDTPARSEWTVTDTEHPSCTGCADQARTAAVYAVAAGSVGGTHTTDRRGLDEGLVVLHSATVARTAPRPAPVVDDAEGADESLRHCELPCCNPDGPAAESLDFLEE